MICYHHNDIDGRTAAYLVHLLKPSGIEDFPENYVECDYHTKFNKHTDKDDVFIVDLSISDATYPMFIECCKTARSVTWIDHHKTSIDIVEKHIDELQRQKNLTYFISGCACGAALVYAFFGINRSELLDIRRTAEDEYYNIGATYVNGAIKVITTKMPKDGKNIFDYTWHTYSINLPPYLYHIDDYDCWKKLDPTTDRFILGIDAEDTSLTKIDSRSGRMMFNPFWSRIIQGSNLIDYYAANGEIIQNYINHRYQKELSDTFEWEYNGTTFICKNGSGNSWEFMDLITRYEACILFNYSGKSGMWEYSVYSSDKSKFKCNEFCKQFGGGGHEHAAGFSTKTLLFTDPKLFKEVKEDIIFLGGTIGNYDWREKFIDRWKKLNPDSKTTLYNPVVENWTKENEEEENRIKKIATLNLFVINPNMEGVYSIAEIVDCASYSETYFAVIMPDTFTAHQIKSLEAVGRLIAKHGAHFKIYESKEDWADQLIADIHTVLSV